METQYVPCDLCGSEVCTVLWDKTEREKAGILRSVVIRDENGGIVQGRNVMCKRCGLVYVSPRMSKAELDRFYAEDYRKIYGGACSLESEKRHAGTAFRLIRHLLPAECLDIGCSTGQLIRMTGGCGIEPNAEYCEVAQKAGLNVANTTIEDYDPGIRFDVITMLNALEHVASPSTVLTKIHDLLNDDGHVLISVPNLLNTHLNIPVDAFLSNAHLYNFTPATLHMMMGKAGLHAARAYLVAEEMGEKIYVLAQKGEPTELIFDDHIAKRYEYTKRFLTCADELFALKHVLSGGGIR